jgi:hypothetical protein
VIAGQSWHWVDPVAGAGKAADVLAPDGRIALFWNAMVLPVRVAQGFATAYRRVLPDFPFFQNGTPGGAASYAPLTERAANGICETRQYSEPQRWKFEWSRPYTAAQWLDAVPTFGGHHQIPPDKLVELLDGLGVVIEAAGGSFTMGYDALVITATRTETH